VSHVVLQRVMVRMLYDPVFTRAVLAGPEAALAGLDLSDEERDWLRRPDSRAWRVDPERPVRSLNILLQQYPAAGALAVRSTGSAEMLLRFFRSAAFHACVQDRGSMATAFGEYLVARTAAGEVPDPRVAEVARLERALVRLHRDAGFDPAPVSTGAAWRLSPDKALHTAAGGTADLHEAVHQALAGSRGDLARAVLESPAPLPGDALDGDRTEYLLLELARDDGPRVRFAAGVTEITEGLHAFLGFASVGREFDALAAGIERLGADPAEAPEVIRGLIEDGTLVAAG